MIVFKREKLPWYFFTHEPTCHGEDPEDREWCCLACCAAGHVVQGHWRCTPTKTCGGYAEGNRLRDEASCARKAELTEIRRQLDELATSGEL